MQAQLAFNWLQFWGRRRAGLLAASGREFQTVYSVVFVKMLWWTDVSIELEIAGDRLDEEVPRWSCGFNEVARDNIGSPGCPVSEGVRRQFLREGEVMIASGNDEVATLVKMKKPFGYVSRIIYRSWKIVNDLIS